jgi:DNA replication protein DnaC
MTVTQALHIKDKQRAEAEAKAEARTIALCKEIPALSEIDRKLAAYGPALVGFAIAGDREGLARLEQENLELQERRKQVLIAHGYRENEDAPVYQCPVCSDSGYTKGSLCVCVKKQLTLSAYASAGLGKGLIDKTFDNFSLKYYTGEDLTRMEKVLSICKEYVQTFTPTSQPLLFLGKTGLGKTHLSAAIAGGVAAKGYKVIYETSQKLFDTYEAARFARENAPDTEKYGECDLLLIDDLGAECGSQYTAATFFNLLNTRLMEGKPTVINTNLNRPQLEKTYGERVLSRLLGEFRVLLFTGSDVRMQKLSEK